MQPATCSVHTSEGQARDVECKPKVQRVEKCHVATEVSRSSISISAAHVTFAAFLSLNESPPCSLQDGIDVQYSCTSVLRDLHDCCAFHT